MFNMTFITGVPSRCATNSARTRVLASGNSSDK